MSKTAIYPGTFDPITYGHIDVIKKGLNLFDKIVVGVSDVNNKNYLFNSDERIEIVKNALFKDLKLNKKKITIVSFSSLTTDLCKKYKSNIILRGLRAVSDFEYEFQLAGMNRKLNSKIETLFLMSDVENQIISSRFVKEIVKLSFLFIPASWNSYSKSDTALSPLSIIFVLFFLLINQSIAEENIMILKLKDGDVKIELFPDVAPNHVKRIKELADSGKYDGVVFHRVIDGFMAQTGDVQFGNSSNDNFDLRRAGMGGSDLPDLGQEFSSLPHERGTLSMARAQDPNSANSQFFICFKPAPFLDRQYTVFGKVIEGMEHVDSIKRGDSNNNGAVDDPDKIISFKSL
jgi:pantetheine-phosphate adenylyltransferase